VLVGEAAEYRRHVRQGPFELRRLFIDLVKDGIDRDAALHGLNSCPCPRLYIVDIGKLGAIPGDLGGPAPIGRAHAALAVDVSACCPLLSQLFQSCLVKALPGHVEQHHFLFLEMIMGQFQELANNTF